MTIRMTTRVMTMDMLTTMGTIITIMGMGDRGDITITAPSAISKSPFS